jgi:hypothetical protein
MGILLIVELCFWLFAAIMMVTQVVIPLFNSTPLFPYFRSDWQKQHQKKVENLHDRVDQTNAEMDEDELERQLQELRSQKKANKGR